MLVVRRINTSTINVLLIVIASSHAFFAESPFALKPRIQNALSSLTSSEENKRASASEFPNEKVPLSMVLSELSQHLGGSGRAKIVWDCYRAGVNPVELFDPSTRSSGPYEEQWEDLKGRFGVLGKEALRLLTEAGGGIEGTIAHISDFSQSADGTTKLLVRFVDGLEVETVIIPWLERGTSTLCISSQVGCRQGCTFCATGRMGRLRNLSSDEILSQVYFANKVCRIFHVLPVDNVVFMGMGEAADNAHNVVHATKILTHQDLFRLTKTKITVSTVAPTPKAFGDLAQAPCVLAWSVHAARDDLRRLLVPTTNHSMEELRGAFAEAILARPKSLRSAMLQVVLIQGINDSTTEAEEMAKFAQGLIDLTLGSKLVVNLIPFNDIGYPLYQKPSLEALLNFQNVLMKHNIRTYLRTTRGDDESSACGQLATKKTKILKQRSVLEIK